MSFFDKCKVKILPESIEMKVITDADYFSSKYLQYISNSKLKLINPQEGGSPQLFKDGLKSDYDSSLAFGNAIHCLLLQPDDFYLSDYQFKPSAKQGVFWDYLIKFRKEGLSIQDSIDKASDKANYYKGKLTQKLLRKSFEAGFRYYLDATKTDLLELKDGKEPIIVTPRLHDEITGCINAVKENSEIMDELSLQNLSNSKIFRNEEALFADIQVILPDGKIITLPFKGKLDNYSIDPDNKEIILNDLKTTGKFIQYFMGDYVDRLDENGKFIEKMFLNGSFQKYHYYRQMGIYMLLLQLYTKSLGYTDYTYKANMLVVESQAPYNSRKYFVNNSYIKEGLKEFKELICRVAYHTIYGFDIELNEDE